MEATRFAVAYAAPELAEGPAHLEPCCTMLAAHGLAPLSVPSDSTPHLLRILRRLWPPRLIQRWLVHLQRHGLRWCRQQPTRRDTQPLRPLLRRVLAIHTAADRKPFGIPGQAGEPRDGQRGAGAAETGWVVSDLNRARSLVLTA